MKKTINLILSFTLVFAQGAFAKGKIQNEDIKSLTELTAAGGSASSLINDTKIYVTGNGVNDQLSTAINNGLLGGGGGSKNYLANGVVTSNSAGTPNPGNGDFEKNSTAGFSLAHTALTSLAPTSVATAGAAFSSSSGGTAAAGTLTHTVASTLVNGLISKKYSGSLASSAASTPGDMLISSAFAIDAVDQAKVLNFSVNYKVVSGATNLNLSASSASSYAVYIYDVTNGAWIQPSGVYSMDGSGNLKGSFQTTSNSTKYQIALINVNASGGAFTLTTDDYAVGPNASAANDGRLISLQVTGSSAPAAGGVVGLSNVIKDSTNSFVVGTGLFTVPVTGDYVVQFSGNTPSGTSNLSVQLNGTGGTFIGSVNSTLLDSAVGTFVNLKAGTTIGVISQNAVSIVNATLNIYRLSGPTSGDEGRVVAFAASGSSGSAVGSGTAVQVLGWTPSIDTHAGWSSGGQSYTAQVAGMYRIKWNVVYAAAATSGVGTLQNRLLVNGSVSQNEFCSAGTTGSQVRSCTAVYTQALKVGESITFGVYQDTNTTLNLASGGMNVTVERISGSSAPSAQESVYMSGQVAATALASGSTLIPFVKALDSHNAYSAGVYTCPVSGKYEASASLVSATAVVATSTYLQGVIYKNGSPAAYLAITYGNGSTMGLGSSGSAILSCNAGDTLSFYAATNASLNLNATAAANNLTIKKIGN
jgi:hypothetical protein